MCPRRVAKQHRWPLRNARSPAQHLHLEGRSRATGDGVPRPQSARDDRAVRCRARPARQCPRQYHRLPHLNLQNIRCGRYAARPVAGRLGDPRRPPMRSRHRRVPDGNEPAAAVIIASRGGNVFRRSAFAWALAATAAFLLAMSGAALAEAPSGPPITIGFSMPLTGGLAVNGTSGLLAMQIWTEDTNKKGGLLGRPVKLVYYDDQTNPSLVPGIYTKLLDVDKVDLVVSAYGTNVTAPALPVVIQHNMTFMGLFAMDVNEEFHYPKYFSMLPVGPDPRAAISEGFFEIIEANKDKLGLKTIALAVDDGEATRNTADGARVNIKKAGLEVVYDKTYPPTTTDFTPIIR